MKDRLEQIKSEALAKIEESSALEKLNEIRVAYLGKKGELTSVLKSMKDVAPEDRPKVGQMVNAVSYTHLGAGGGRKDDIGTKRRIASGGPASQDGEEKGEQVCSAAV